jgi:hypothetical protein
MFIPTMTALDELESGEYDVSSRHNTETIT